MNCTSHERHLGRRLTLTTVDGQVAQIDHQERIASGLLKSLRGRPSPRNEIRFRFEDGREESLWIQGRGFKVAPGQRITAVRASGSGRNEPILYCYNHETRRGWFNNPGFANVRRRAPYRMLFWFIPLLALIALWMSPQQTRADLAGWVEQISEQQQQTAANEAAAAAPRLFGQSRSRQPEQLATAPTSQGFTLDSIRQRTTQFVLSGWRERDWITFVVVAVLLIPFCAMLGNVLIAWPAGRSLRRRSKRLAQRHCSAIKSG